MDILKIVRLAGAVSILAALPAGLAIVVHAESTSPSTPQPRAATPPAASSAAAQKAAPDAAAKSKPADSNMGAATISNVTIGTAVFGADGKQVGEVAGVKSEASGTVNEIHVKTSALVGLGGKIVVIPGSKITKGGQTVQLALKSDEVGKLPILAEGNRG